MNRQERMGKKVVQAVITAAISVFIIWLTDGWALLFLLGAGMYMAFNMYGWPYIKENGLSSIGKYALKSATVKSILKKKAQSAYRRREANK